MTDDIFKSKNVYSSSEVAAILKVKDSTLRKYAGILEENGYTFLKNSQGHRDYIDKDLIVFKKIMEIKNRPNMTLKQACITVIAWNKEKHVAVPDTGDITEAERNVGIFLADLKTQQEKYNSDLLDQLKQHLNLQRHQQQEYIDKSLNRRDQILMEFITQSQKDNLIAASQEVEQETAQHTEQKTAQEPSQEVKSKKSWFKFWSK